MNKIAGWDASTFCFRTFDIIYFNNDSMSVNANKGW